MFGVSGKLKFILVSALFVALGVPLAGSRTIAAEHSAATPPVSASAKNTTEEAAVKESEGAASDPSIPEVKLTSRILFQLIASEIALQRGQAGAAYQTYLTLAEETGDPRIAERMLHFHRRAERLEIVAPVPFQKIGVLMRRLHSVVFGAVIFGFHDLSDHSARRDVEDTVEMQSACFTAALPYADMLPAFA